jgi:hypothetical protein
MTTLMQDVRYALRQLAKTPSFSITVLLTLALGIGANAAIFTLVNAVLLKNLPVTDPKTLVRLGDNNDCCVNSGVKDDGDYTLFSTDTYEQFKKNAPEFEELAAMQAGFGYRPRARQHRDRRRSFTRLQLQNLMVVTIGVDGVVQLVQQFAAIARQEVDAANAALLQAFVGIECLAQHLRVAGDEFALQSLGSGRLGMQTIELMFDLRTGGFRSIDQRAVELHQFFFDARQV